MARRLQRWWRRCACRPGDVPVAERSAQELAASAVAIIWNWWSLLPLPRQRKTALAPLPISSPTLTAVGRVLEAAYSPSSVVDIDCVDSLGEAGLWHRLTAVAEPDHLAADRLPVWATGRFSVADSRACRLRHTPPAVDWSWVTRMTGGWDDARWKLQLPVNVQLLPLVVPPAVAMPWEPRTPPFGGCGR